MIKAVIFDVGGVIVTRVLRNMARDLSKKHGMDFDFLNRAIHTGWNEYKLDKITADKFWQHFVDESKISETVEGLKKMALEYISEVPGTMDVVRSLKGRYKLAILSNNANEWVEKEKKIIDFEGIFDVVILSNEVKIAKPYKEIYMLCLEKLGNLRPEECIFVDDQGNNCEAAKKLGFNTIKFEDAEQLKKELNDFGVET